MLTRLGDEEPFYLSIAAALLVFMVAYVCGMLGDSALFNHIVRVFLKDYGTPLTVIFFTGFVYIGRMKPIDLETLPTSKAFEPTSRSSWLVDPRDVSVGEAFIAAPFGILLTILFWFDHNGQFHSTPIPENSLMALKSLPLSPRAPSFPSGSPPASTGTSSSSA